MYVPHPLHACMPILYTLPLSTHRFCISNHVAVQLRSFMEACMHIHVTQLSFKRKLNLTGGCAEESSSLAELTLLAVAGLPVVHLHHTAIAGVHMCDADNSSNQTRQGWHSHQLEAMCHSNNRQ